MKKAIWFSRHNPTKEQIADAEWIGYRIEGIELGQKLGAIELKNNYDVRAVVTDLLALLPKFEAKAIFGVPPTPIVRLFAHTALDAVERGKFFITLNDSSIWDVPFYAAWNVQRSVEGEGPAFSHKEWCLVGFINQKSLLWLD